MRYKTLLAGVTAAAFAVSGATTAQAANFASYHSPAAPMLTGAAGVDAKPLFSVSETLPNGYRPVGIMDGIGAWRTAPGTVRIAVNHELGATSGRSYGVVDGMGGVVSLTGARMSVFDIDVATRGIVNAGQAYDRIYDRTGAIVSNASQINGGLARLCSGAAFEANSFGQGHGLANRIYFGGEETANGTMYALDTDRNALYAVPAMGRGAWENTAQINTGNAKTVAFVLSDDTSGSASDAGTPLYLYVGEKGAKGDGSFLDANGLAQGKMYVWRDNAGKADPRDFNGKGASSDGQWVEIASYDPSKAGQPGYDAQGYADQATLRAEATAAGAFKFSRPEDLATNPADDTLIALSSTGSSRFGGADTWGTVYTVDTQFDANGQPTTAATRIVYDGNQDATRALRSPDNLDWASASELLIQEDAATDWTKGANLAEAGILSVSLDGTVKTVARINRSATMGLTDTSPNELGAWESSGILDVSALFGLERGMLFLSDVQAHTLQVGASLVEGGQLLLIDRSNAAIPEPESWALMMAGFGLIAVIARRRQGHRQNVRTATA